ncbi:MAG: CHAD domain-containing protein [Olsenella sp.]|nr:CHAD domain-containing protein [Olsenella sp.]
MVRTLVLVRHGKAEKAQDDSSDLYRELTPDGRHALEIAYPRTFSLLEDYDDVNVWSSPAIRAMQTAQVVASVLGVDGIEVDQTLYDQNYDALLGQIATTPEETVVVVGHVPSLDAIASHLLGRQVRLSKGAAIALELPQPAPAAEGEAAGSTPALPSSASLLWFVDGPKSSAWGSLVSIEGEVTASAGELAAEAERFFTNPDDVDALCDFRMAVRRLRSLVSFLSPWESKKQAERADKILRNLLDATARLRGIDIFSQTVDDLVEAGELGENSLLPVACAHERKLERSSFMELVRKKGLVKKVDSLVEELSAFRWKKSVLARGLGEGDLRSRFDEELDALDQALFGLDLSSANAVYDARRDAKELHYVANRLGVVLGDERAQMSQYMDEIQRDLGALCNARTNATLADEFRHSPRFRGVRADLGVAGRDQSEVVSAIVSGMRRREATDEAAVDEEDVPAETGALEESAALEADVATEAGALAEVTDPAENPEDAATGVAPEDAAPVADAAPQIPAE